RRSPSNSPSGASISLPTRMTWFSIHFSGGALAPLPRNARGATTSATSSIRHMRRPPGGGWRPPFRLGLVAEDAPISASDLLRWSEALSGIARTGLGFTKSLYEQERFEEVLKVAADIRVAAGHELESEMLVEEWLKQVGEGVPGYVTPKVAIG